jgi:hypothetical protein
VPNIPPEVRDVLEIALTPVRWSDAHRAFQAVRKLVLAAEGRAPATPDVDLGILYLAENVAKVAYNASGCSAPFDHNAGWWVAKNARWIVDHSSHAGLDGRVWAALSGRPDLADVKQLSSDELRVLWTVDFYDGELSGIVFFDGKVRWFEFCAEVEKRRRYVVYELSEAEVADEQYWHALFVEHVGDHWTAGSPGKVKPVSEHAKFFDAYAKRSPVDYSRNPILGWFEL